MKKKIVLKRLLSVREKKEGRKHIDIYTIHMLREIKWNEMKKKMKNYESKRLCVSSIDSYYWSNMKDKEYVYIMFCTGFLTITINFKSL
jgi:hypothetical protein